MRVFEGNRYFCAGWGPFGVTPQQSFPELVTRPQMDYFLQYYSWILEVCCFTVKWWGEKSIPSQSVQQTSGMG